jgi:phosphoribosylaminoimidazole carboxylase PurE protein
MKIKRLPKPVRNRKRMIEHKVLIIIGSKSDEQVMSETTKLLKDFDIPFELVVSSAHRNPEKTKRLAQSAEKKGMKIIICGAGMAAHLPGVVASWTNLPVIGVPIQTSAFKGIDSLLSILQMPSGVPVATMSVGVPGAKNAAILAAQILALSDDKIKKKLKK